MNVLPGQRRLKYPDLKTRIENVRFSYDWVKGKWYSKMKEVKYSLKYDFVKG